MRRFFGMFFTAAAIITYTNSANAQTWGGTTVPPSDTSVPDYYFYTELIIENNSGIGKETPSIALYIGGNKLPFNYLLVKLPPSSSFNLLTTGDLALTSNSASVRIKTSTMDINSPAYTLKCDGTPRFAAFSRSDKAYNFNLNYTCNSYYNAIKPPKWGYVPYPQAAFISNIRGGVIGIKGNAQSNNKIADLESKYITSNQNWYVLPIGLRSGRYQLENLSSGLCLDILGGSRKQSAPVVQYKCHKSPTQTDSQVWYPITSTGQLANSLTHACLKVDVPGESSINMDKYCEHTISEQWYENNVYSEIYNVQNSTFYTEDSYNGVGSLLSVDTGPSNKIVLSGAAKGAATQLWSAVYDLTDLASSTASILDLGSGKCLDLDHGSTSTGTGIVQFECHANIPINRLSPPFDSQKWLFLKTEDRQNNWHVRVVSAASIGYKSTLKCLQFNSGAKTNIQLTIAPCELSHLQYWYFDTVN